MDFSNTYKACKFVTKPDDFRRKLKNVEGLAKLGATTFAGVIATGKIKHVKSHYLPVWEMVKQVVPLDQLSECKMPIITPTWQHLHLTDGAFTPEAYNSAKEYFDDLTAAYRQELKSLYDAGLPSI